MLELCNRDELQGVIAHEIAHIVNRDTTYLLYASIVISMITTMARVFARSSGRRSSNSSGGILDIVVLIIMIIAPLLAHIFYFMLSRKREYLADACAVQFTRYPVGLASALNKISGNTYLSCLDDKVALKQFNENPFLKASCIVPAFSNKRDGWFSTHPSTMNRIKILMKMSESADFSNYNSAYCSITKSKPIIPISDIHNSTKIPIRLGEPMVGLVGLVGAEMTPEVQKLECGERIERRREVEDMMWKYERYRFINCSCETRLKIPPTFKGKEVTCPHCKTKHILS